MSRKKSRFYIGQPVVVKATCEMKYVCDEGREETGPWHRKPARKPCDEFIGVIVGAAYRTLGMYRDRHFADNIDDDYYDPPYIEADGSVIVWLVTHGMTNRHVEVLNEDVEPAIEGTAIEVPWRACKQPPLPDIAREMLRQDALAAKRDAKGRFVRNSP